MRPVGQEQTRTARKGRRRAAAAQNARNTGGFQRQIKKQAELGGQGSCEGRVEMSGAEANSYNSDVS